MSICLQEVHSPESGVIVKTAKDGGAEGLVYGGGGKEGIFIKQVVPESPASKSLKLKEGKQAVQQDDMMFCISTVQTFTMKTRNAQNFKGILKNLRCI